MRHRKTQAAASQDVVHNRSAAATSSPTQARATAALERTPEVLHQLRLGGANVGGGRVDAVRLEGVDLRSAGRQPAAGQTAAGGSGGSGQPRALALRGVDTCCGCMLLRDGMPDQPRNLRFGHAIAPRGSAACPAAAAALIGRRRRGLTSSPTNAPRRSARLPPP